MNDQPEKVKTPQGDEGYVGKTSNSFVINAARLVLPERKLKSVQDSLAEILQMAVLAACVKNGEARFEVIVKAKDGLIDSIHSEGQDVALFVAQLSEEEIIQGLTRAIIHECDRCPHEGLRSALEKMAGMFGGACEDFEDEKEDAA